MAFCTWHCLSTFTSLSCCYFVFWCLLSQCISIRAQYEQPQHQQQQPQPVAPGVPVVAVPTPAVVHQDSESQPRSWYESLPAVAMDYKVHIDAGKEDCYWQYVQPGATFYVSFQVIRGGDGMAGFAVRNPTGAVVHPYQWQTASEYTDQTSIGGYYAVCIDNQFSRFAGKLISLYITVIRYDEWDKYSKEIQELEVSVQNFTAVIMSVERNINEMLQYQSHSRNREARDISLLVDNNAYVQNWSLTQIVVIVLTTCVQVYFVRRLFDIKSGFSSRTRI